MLCSTHFTYSFLSLVQAVLASMSDLECGFSRQLFIQWASVQRNSIILTSKPPQGTLARQLINDLNVKSIDLTVRVCVCVCVRVCMRVYSVSINKLSSCPFYTLHGHNGLVMGVAFTRPSDEQL